MTRSQKSSLLRGSAYEAALRKRSTKQAENIAAEEEAVEVST